MTKYIKYHKNYTEFGEPYQLVLPLNLEGLVPDDDSVRLLSHELEDLNYSLLYQAYSAKGRNPAVDPKTMFKILTYAYSQNIYLPERLKLLVNVISISCGCLLGRKHQITVQLQDSVLDFWPTLRRPVLSDGSRLEQMNELSKRNRIYRWYEAGSLCQ